MPLPSRTPAEAVEHYRGRTVRLLSCVTSVHVVVRAYHASDAPHQLELADTAKMRGGPFSFDVAEQYEVRQDVDGWRVEILGYLYAIGYERLRAHCLPLASPRRQSDNAAAHARRRRHPGRRSVAREGPPTHGAGRPRGGRRAGDRRAWHRAPARRLAATDRRGRSPLTAGRPQVASPVSGADARRAGAECLSRRAGDRVSR